MCLKGNRFDQAKGNVKIAAWRYTECNDKTHANKVILCVKAIESRDLKLLVTDGKHPV